MMFCCVMRLYVRRQFAPLHSMHTAQVFYSNDVIYPFLSLQFYTNNRTIRCFICVFPCDVSLIFIVTFVSSPFRLVSSISGMHLSGYLVDDSNITRNFFHNCNEQKKKKDRNPVIASTDDLTDLFFSPLSPWLKTNDVKWTFWRIQRNTTHSLREFNMKIYLVNWMQNGKTGKKWMQNGKTIQMTDF